MSQQPSAALRRSGSIVSSARGENSNYNHQSIHENVDRVQAGQDSTAQYIQQMLQQQLWQQQQQQAAFQAQFTTQQNIPPPPIRPQRRDFADDQEEKIYQAQLLRYEAYQNGETMTFAEAYNAITQTMSIEAAQQARLANLAVINGARVQNQGQQNKVLSLGKYVKPYSGEGSIVDWLFTLETRMDQAGVTLETERKAALRTLVDGQAANIMRVHADRLERATYVQVKQFLLDQFGLHEDGVRAQLGELQYNPDNGLKAFNTLFNLIASQVSTLSNGDQVRAYLQAIGRGDEKLARDIVMMVDADLAAVPLRELQIKLQKKVDKLAYLSTQLHGGKPAVEGFNLSGSGLGVATGMTALQEALLNASIPPSEAAATQGSTSAGSTKQPNTQGNGIGQGTYNRNSQGNGTRTNSNRGPGLNEGNRQNNGPRTCYRCGSLDHLARDCPLRAEQKKEMVSKAVGFLLGQVEDQLDAQDASSDNIVPSNYALWYAPTVEPSLSAAVTTGLAGVKAAAAGEASEKAMLPCLVMLAQYCRDNPTDEKAANYLLRGISNSQDLLATIMNDGEAALASRIYADAVRSKVSRGTQAGERGIAVDMWPGITDILRTISSKSSLLDLLVESGPFLQSMLELCIEISQDKQLGIDFSALGQEITKARQERKFGKYAADIRAQARLHGAEQARITAPKISQTVSKASRWGPPVIREEEGSVAQDDADMGLIAHTKGTIHDLTHMYGPATQHHIITIALHDQKGAKHMLKAIRDSGAASTVITKAYAEAVGIPWVQLQASFGTLGGGGKFVGMIPNAKIALDKEEKLILTHDVMLSDDTFPLMLLGNDMFNADKVRTLHHSDQPPMYVWAIGQQVGIVTYEIQTSKAPSELMIAADRVAASALSQSSSLGNNFIQSVASPRNLIVPNVQHSSPQYMELAKASLAQVNNKGITLQGSSLNLFDEAAADIDLDALVEKELLETALQSGYIGIVDILPSRYRYPIQGHDNYQGRIYTDGVDLLDGTRLNFQAQSLGPYWSHRQTKRLTQAKKVWDNLSNRSQRQVTTLARLQSKLEYDEIIYNLQDTAPLFSNDDAKVTSKFMEQYEAMSIEEKASLIDDSRKFLQKHRIEQKELSDWHAVDLSERLQRVTLGKGIEEYLSEVYQLTAKLDDCFAYSKQEMGCLKDALYDIELTDTTPWSHKPYWKSHSDRQFEKVEINGLLSCFIIESCISPWGFPSLVVHRHVKSEDKRRLCIDFRELNRRTVGDAFPMPDCDGILGLLAQAQWYATLDLKSGFWQIGLSERAKSYCVFITSEGQYRFKRMAFGLKNAPAFFQRQVTRILNQYVGIICLVYIDDVVVWGQTAQECLKHVELVVRRLKEYGLMCNGEKCCLLSQRIELLGHIIERGQVTPQVDKLEVLKEAEVPQTVKDVQKILGVLGYFRKFVKDYALIMAPVTALLNVKIKEKDPKKRAKIQQNQKIVWTPSCQAAVVKVIEILENDAWLLQPDYEKEFYMYTDYSGIGIGGVLMQQDASGQERPIAMVSRCLTPTEQKYAPIEGEALAIVWCVDRFRHYLLGHKCILRTDHKPLIYIYRGQTSKAKLARWMLLLQEFDIDIEYYAGKANVVADAASRLPLDKFFGLCDEDAFDLSSKIPPTCIYAALHEYRAKWNTKLQAKKCFACRKSEPQDTAILCDRCGEAYHLECMNMSSLPDGYWFCEICQLQIFMYAEKDLIYDKLLINFLRFGLEPQDPQENQRVHKASKYIRWYNDGLQVLRRSAWRVVPPISIRKDCVEERHIILGHIGQRKLLASLQNEYYWANMAATVAEVTAECEECQKSRARFGTLKQMIPTYKGLKPFEVWSIDSIPNLGGTSGLVVIAVCCFSKWVEIGYIPTHQAGQVWDWFYVNIIARYGVPLSVRTDRGTEYGGIFKANLCLWGIQPRVSNTTYPQSNGQAERMVQTVKTSIKKYVAQFPDEDWRAFLPEIGMSLRFCLAKSHGYTPHFVVFGREAYMPLSFQQQFENIQQLDDSPSEQEIESFCLALHELHDTIVNRLQSMDQKYKKQYDLSRTEQEVYDFVPGQPVLLRQRRKGGLLLPASGPYEFRHYTSAAGISAIIRNPLTLKEFDCSVAHLLPYFGKLPMVQPPSEFSRKRAKGVQ